MEGIKNYFNVDNTRATVLNRGTGAKEEVEILTAPVNDLAAIKNICTGADVVIVVAGTTYKDEGEFIGNGEIRDRNNPDKKNFITRTGILGVGGDRKYLHLHQADIDLIHAASSINKSIVVSLVAGSAVTVEEWHEEVPAILETFYNGMEGGNALARILFGDVNPSGKLPFTVPKLESDLPPFNSFEANADYGYYHGYTLFDKRSAFGDNTNSGSPRYPFGFGLSYTQFQISDLKFRHCEGGSATEAISNNIEGGIASQSLAMTTCDTIQVSVKVKNTGARAGAEVVQVYVGFTRATVQNRDTVIDRPEKLLRGFKKIYLQANEERTIDFTISKGDLAYYSTETKTWVVEKGKYEVLVGNSSRDEKMLKESFEVL